jgi:hypothetical protein
MKMAAMRESEPCGVSASSNCNIIAGQSSKAQGFLPTDGLPNE